MKNNLQLFTKEIAHKHNWKTHHVSTIIHEIFDKISKKLIEKEEVSIPNFGKLINIELKKRMAMNPQTKSLIKVPAKRKIKFKMHSHLKRSINIGT